MGTIDWEAFLKGWQGQPTTSPASSSESELLTSSVESAGPILPETSLKPSAELFEVSLPESTGSGLIGRGECFRCSDADLQLSPKSGKDRQSYAGISIVTKLGEKKKAGSRRERAKREKG